MKSNSKRKLKPIYHVLLIILAVLVLYCTVTAAITPMFMVHPNSDAALEANVLAADDISSVSITGTRSGCNLEGYLLDRPDCERLIIFFGGISENAAFCMDRFLGYEDDGFFTDYDIAIVDWPEYGRSSGHANETSLKESACDITSYFNDLYEDVSIMAYSMGTGPAIYAAAECGCEKLVLIAPYASALDLYNAVVNVFHGPMKLLLTYKMESYKFAEGVSVSPLIIASTADKRVPYESSVELSEHFPEGCEFYSLDNLGHDELPYDKGVLNRLSEYLNQ